MALTITRKENERVILILEDDREITITLNDTRQARLTIDAPQEVEIWREELLNHLPHQ